MQPLDGVDSGIAAGLPFPPSSMSLVPFLYGAADLEAFPGTALSRLLTDLDMSEAAARTLLARMRRRGFLHSERVGRRTAYRLSGRMIDHFQQAMRGPERTPWGGAFFAVVFRVPELSRGYRDQPRAHLQRLGYGVLRPGLMISPRDRWDEVLGQGSRTPDSAQVLPARLEMKVEDAREAAEIAWGLSKRSDDYLVVAERLRVAAAADPLPEPNGATLRSYYLLQQTALHLSLSDAGLPVELLPEHWPADDALAARFEFYRRWQPVIEQYVESVLAETRTDDIAVRARRPLQH